MRIATTGNGIVKGLAVEIDFMEDGQFLLKNDHRIPFGENVILSFDNRFEALDFCKLIQTLELKLIGDVERKE